MNEGKPVNRNFCRFLKSKNPFGTFQGGDDDSFVLDDANTIFWCVKSLGAGGPDNGPVDPRLCINGRSCFTKRD